MGTSYRVKHLDNGVISSTPCHFCLPSAAALYLCSLSTLPLKTLSKVGFTTLVDMRPRVIEMEMGITLYTLDVGRIDLNF